MLALQPTPASRRSYARRPTSAAPAVSVRYALVAGAKSVVAHQLRGKHVAGVSERLLKQWRASGRPLAELDLWLADHPEDLEAVVAHLRGVALRDPAPLSDALAAETAADAAEDVAEMRALLEDTPEAWSEYARLAEVAAARLIEAARAARMEAAR